MRLNYSVNYSRIRTYSMEPIRTTPAIIKLFCIPAIEHCIKIIGTYIIAPPPHVYMYHTPYLLVFYYLKTYLSLGLWSKYLTLGERTGAIKGCTQNYRYIHVSTLCQVLFCLWIQMLHSNITHLFCSVNMGWLMNLIYEIKNFFKVFFYMIWRWKEKNIII